MLVGREVVVHGKEGAEIEGRYRIVKIGDESVQIEHSDGRGRQTIRFVGCARDAARKRSVSQ